jgi:hypothetical protein
MCNRLSLGEKTLCLLRLICLNIAPNVTSFEHLILVAKNVMYIMFKTRNYSFYNLFFV